MIKKKKHLISVLFVSFSLMYFKKARWFQDQPPAPDKSVSKFILFYSVIRHFYFFSWKSTTEARMGRFPITKVLQHNTKNHVSLDRPLKQFSARYNSQIYTHHVLFSACSASDRIAWISCGFEPNPRCSHDGPQPRPQLQNSEAKKKKSKKKIVTLLSPYDSF